MIPTLSDYLYRVHHEKAQMLTQMERRRAILLLCGITGCVTVSILLWVIYR